VPFIELGELVFALLSKSFFVLIPLLLKSLKVLHLLALNVLSFSLLFFDKTLLLSFIDFNLELLDSIVRLLGISELSVLNAFNSVSISVTKF